VTISKRLSLATLVLITAGAVILLYMALQIAYGAPAFSYGPGSYLPPLGVGLLTAMGIVVLQRRGARKSIDKICRQIATMADNREAGMVMLGDTDELAEIAPPLNRFIAMVSEQNAELQADNRELRIEARIAAAEKHHTEAIIFSISDAVIVTNRFDELTLANEAAEKLFGFKLDSALRKNIDRICSDGAFVRLVREIRNHARSRTRKIVEHVMEYKGEPRTFRITLSCVDSGGEQVAGVVAVLHDVTREKEIARMKTDFVSNVSHELKTPLASIKAYVEMLVDGEAEDETTRGEFYEIISSETDRLHRLIENILNISRIEAGVVKVIREPLDLTGVVKQAVDVAAPQAKAKGLDFVSQLVPVYYQVEADRDMIYQAVLNLISNAIKYTRNGGRVTVSVAVDERRRVVICEVSDTGMGIPADALPYIFDKFYRVKQNQEIAKGTGLGLTLVKHIVETVHDGELSVRSEEGKGSTFSFELPVIQ